MENLATISLEERNQNMNDRPQCTINLIEPREVIQHFVDLYNIGPMLDINLEEEIYKFRKKLKLVGWSEEKISEFQRTASSRTFWEQSIPHTIKEQGDPFEWLRASQRKS